MHTSDEIVFTWNILLKWPHLICFFFSFPAEITEYLLEMEDESTVRWNFLHFAY